MPRKIYIDCGTHLGEGMKKHVEEFNIDESWIIYTFEANPYTFNRMQEARLAENVSFQYRWVKWNNITYYNKAVWTNDGSIDFYCSTVGDQSVKNHPEYINFMKFHDKLLESGDLISSHQVSDVPIDGGSTIFPTEYKAFLNKSGNALQRGLTWDVKVSAECIDFSSWLKDNIREDDYVICKIDIEGAEYEVLKKCIRDNTLKLIDRLDAELHPFANPNAEYDWSQISYELNRLKIPFRNW